VANDDAASTPEDAAVSGNVLTNDTDVDVEPLTVTNPGTYVGTYGTLVLAADGSYTYTPNAAAQALDDGEVVSDAFGYTASDGTASDTATLTVSVSGLNDAPLANDDAAATTEDAAVSGNVLTNDTDVDVEPLIVANPGTYVGAYGTLVLAADGSYTYTPSAAAQALDDGEVANDAFAYTASDGTASDGATLTVTVTGLNDAPVANDDAASTNEGAAVSGNVLTNDTDVDVEPLTVTSAGTYAGTYGTLALAADGSYTYTPNAAANGLAAGEVAQDVFGYTASDGTASDTATLTVTINGTNDAPTIDAGGTDATGAVTELPNNDPNENAFTHSDTGTVAFDDVDVTDTHTASLTPQAGGYLGTFALGPVDQGADTVGWTFNVADGDLDFLDDGETLTQTYTVEIDDGNGGTTTQDVTITLTGAADGPQTVWYIDNSAGGSANLGTQADPFTSIAAFNAAQGTAGGPQIGATVYLLAGTGTYAEADGINLLADQILTGVASGPLRPTIVTTGGANHGIELAQNNTVSGIDIGNTTGAGISDGGGTVGTLTISDVGKSGSGQIVDIDQGGTLNVTLNDAGSTGSAGGAIDLAGVGGTFTVSGATTITGVHSGGGVDITGSSVAASFAGGGLVSTGSTTAVNFAGNTGSLALGGGLDVVTTTGAGVTATGGGTVTATGAGNSITSTTGVALAITGTAIGAADFTLESVSANGGGYAIRLNGTGSAGGLHITGVGSTDGSGGTIQNIATRGIELIDTTDVVLNNVALINANTTNGTSTDLVVANSNGAIYLSSVVGAALTNVDINGAADSGIVGINVADFVMNDSTVTLAGNALNESGIEFTNLSGSSSLSNTEISFSETNSLDIVNTDVSLNLVLDNVTFRDTQLASSGGPVNANGEGGLQFRSFSTLAGAPVTNIDIVDSDFLRLRSQGIQVIGEDDSVISVDITNNTVASQTDIGTGIDLAANDVSQFAFNVIGNTVQSRGGNAINVISSGGGDIEGRINQNVITADLAGTGIRVAPQDNGSTAIVEARDNGITMGAGNSGSPIDVLARFGNARLDLTLDNNTLDSNTSAVADINITAGASASGETASVYANIINNDVLAGGPTNVLRLRTADLDGTSDPRIFLQGFIEAGAGLDDDAVATWNANGNTPLATAASVNVTQTGGATSPSAGTALVPDNPTPLMASSLAHDCGGGVSLTQSALDAIVDAAIQRWADAGADDTQVAAMLGTSFAVADLAGLDLGLHGDGVILIDGDGAGFGWFVDATSLDDAEFAGDVAGMDLLTVVMHELGHAAGLEDHYSAGGESDLMHGFLDPGERRLPDGVFGADTAPISEVAFQSGDFLQSYQDVLPA
jgi:VCBS repeat-containing protein